MICKRFYISGTVQGVCYRAFTQQTALQLGLTGWAKNLVDGRVEVFACGEPAALAGFEKQLWEGPLLAKVSAVEAIAAPGEHHRGFSVL